MDKNKTNETTDLCPVCSYPMDKCVCCAECGHDCPLDHGEAYCPVCGPVPGNANG